jgi:hypothetical protein
VSWTGTCWRVEGHPHTTLWSAVDEQRYITINIVPLNRSMNQVTLQQFSMRLSRVCAAVGAGGALN